MAEGRALPHYSQKQRRVKQMVPSAVPAKPGSQGGAERVWGWKAETLVRFSLCQKMPCNLGPAPSTSGTLLFPHLHSRLGPGRPQDTSRTEQSDFQSPLQALISGPSRLLSKTWEYSANRPSLVLQIPVPLGRKWVAALCDWVW